MAVSPSDLDNERASVLRHGDGFMRWPSGSGTSGPAPERVGKKKIEAPSENSDIQPPWNS
jgi:hypothetical protein